MMTTDELKSLLRDVLPFIPDAPIWHYKDCRKLEDGADCTCGGKEPRHLRAQIDSALASDFAVVPREPTQRLEASYWHALEDYGTKNFYPVWKAMIATSEEK
jgi:hypothetical protein